MGGGGFGQDAHRRESRHWPGCWQGARPVRKLSFTGSTEVGRVLMRQCADTIKKLSLELGGNTPFIVFDDADSDAAVEDALASKFRNTGQTCVCANRLYVQSGVYDAFAEKLAAKVKAFKGGSGTETGENIGPLIDVNGLAKVEEHVAACIAVYPPVLFYTGSARTSGAVPASGLMGEGATDAAAIAASATTYARKDFPPPFCSMARATRWCR